MTAKEKKLKIDISGVDPICNKSKGDDFYDVVNRQLSRRSFLKGGLGVAVSSFMLSPLMAGCASSKGSARSSAGLGFQAIAGNRTDVVDVPVGYRAQPFLPWGTPLVPGAGEFKPDASNSALDQARQVGSHHDGMHFFPIDVKEGGASSKEGLLVMNHEYVDPQILHTSFSQRTASAAGSAERDDGARCIGSSYYS